MDGAAHDLAVLGEDGLHVGLGDQQGVEVADEDAGVEGARVGLVGHVAAGHQAGVGGRRPTTQQGREGDTRSETILRGKEGEKKGNVFFLALQFCVSAPRSV